MCNKITYNDINQWINDFQKLLSKINESERTGELECTTTDIKCALLDALYLVALVESLMTLDEPDGVLERAKELQGRK